MSDLFTFGLGWASGFIGCAIVIGTAWMRFGRMTAIADAYEGAIIDAFRRCLAHKKGTAPPPLDHPEPRTRPRSRRSDRRMLAEPWA